jgi:glucose/arabinose dehydrogenase
VGIPPTADGRVISFGSLTAAIDPLPPKARWEILQGSRLVLHLAASADAVQARLAVAKVTPAAAVTAVQRGELRPAATDLALLQQSLESGPVAGKSKVKATPRAARWPQSISVNGQLGAADGAYAVDSIPLPDENPWNAWMRPGGFDFFSDGDRGALCTWSGDVWTVSGLKGDLGSIRWRRFAAGLFQPLGLKIVHDQIHVLGRDQITRLVDLDGDGEADRYENFNNDVSITPNFHEFALDLHADAHGNFYFTKGGPLLGTDYWDPIGMHNGSVLKVSADGKKLERYATGLRAPNGSGVGSDGQVTCSDNEGIWTPVCRLNWVKPGGFYGAMGLDHRDTQPTTYDPPLCWLPFAIDNSSGGQVWTDSRFGPLSNSLIHLSYGKCRAFTVLRETVGGGVQGGVVPLPWRFQSSAMRGRIHPKDGSLWVTGLKGWQTSAPRDGALHRVRPTGKPMPRLIGVHATPGHLQLEFNVPLKRGESGIADGLDVQEWNYRWSESYGSSLYSVAQPGKITGKKGELTGDVLKIRATTVESNSHTLDLSVEDLKPAMQLMIRGSVTTAGGDEMPVEYYGSVHRLQ